MRDTWFSCKSPRRAAGFVLGVLLAQPASAGSVEPARDWQGKVHPLVLEQTDAGAGEFILFLADQARPLPPESLASKTERTRFVFERLREHADRIQAPLIEMLDGLGVEYRSYWIANMIWVRGTRPVLQRLASRSEVLRVDANPRVKVKIPGPADRHTADKSGAAIEWNIAQVNAPGAWASGHLGEGVVVGGQDTGYQWDHPALINQYRGWDGLTASHDHNWHDAIHSGGGVCGADAPAPCDDHSHGTHTMGTIVGDDGGTNSIGMAPQAKWIGCRNMDRGFGTPQTYTECFQWFVAPTDRNDQNPDPSLAPEVINNSWACPPIEGCSEDTLRAVVENTRAAGIVVVASAGNGGSRCSSVLSPPAHYDATFSVGATDSVDEIASFSSRGPVTVDGSGRLKPDVSAPGVSLRSSVPTDGYAFFSGTSMAGPHVVGAVALLLGARPDLKGRVDMIEELVRSSALGLTTLDGCGGDTASSIPNNTYGSGRIDAQALLEGDVDNDGADNLADCSPLDANLWSEPGAARDLMLSRSGAIQFSWDPPASPGGTLVFYDLLRSTIAADFTGAECVANDLTLNQASDGSAPTRAFYLVRSHNACGESLAPSSTGPRKDPDVCP